MIWVKLFLIALLPPPQTQTKSSVSLPYIIKAIHPATFRLKSIIISKFFIQPLRYRLIEIGF
ncbi:MAG: hypothetical protein B6D55_05435 [Candidatus Omnitrophica bacterium 4484_70.2]|nr:MAG: hypothetical protein B6D55_05435 [Candidatus Omnitrophica bacterium 4484_70.2]